MGKILTKKLSFIRNYLHENPLRRNFRNLLKKLNLLSVNLICIDSPRIFLNKFVHN